MLSWTETLDGPRSLITGQNIALVTIEDPGLIEVRGKPRDRALGKALRTLTGSPLPTTPWSSAGTETLRLLWRGPDRWWLLLPRAEAAGVADDLAATCGRKAAVADLTGAHAALRLVGSGAAEALARTCPLDLRSVEPLQARGTTIAEISVTLLRESESVPAWLILVPRSFAEGLARELARAIRTTAALDLFGSRTPPV